MCRTLRIAGGVRPDVYLGQILITRTLLTRRAYSFARPRYYGRGPERHPLQEDDEIRVFSTSEFRPTRYVAINGAVRKSGQFPYRERQRRVHDLRAATPAGWTKAFLNEAEVARLPKDRTGGVTATTFRVPLDSSYIFERAADGKYLGPPGLPAASGPNPKSKSNRTTTS